MRSAEARAMNIVELTEDELRPVARVPSGASITERENPGDAAVVRASRGRRRESNLRGRVNLG